MNRLQQANNFKTTYSDLTNWGMSMKIVHDSFMTKTNNLKLFGRNKSKGSTQYSQNSMT